MSEMTLKKELLLFQQKLNDNLATGKNSVEKMRNLFEPIAKHLLYGGYFVVSSGNKIIRRIFPFTVEFYYHEEWNHGIPDYIVYHRYPDNPKLREEGCCNPFKINTLHSHVSGIDITFEGTTDSAKVYRASALIRAYQVKEGDKGIPSIEGGDIPDHRSTYFYNHLLMDTDIEDGIQIKWKNDAWTAEGPLYNGYRYNVNKYEVVPPTKSSEWPKHVKMTTKNPNYKDCKPEELQDKNPWAFSRGKFEGLCEIKDNS